jgi:GMP synthase (glutamine-hydrolysing)
MRRVLVVQAGSADPAVRARFGDYPDWFARHLAPQVELRVVRPYEEPLPAALGFDGILVTGSPRSVLDREPWMADTGGYLLQAARDRPVLGVCFGHQLLADALGGRVERNPRGREAGTSEVELTEAGRRDPLFASLPDRFAAQQTHADHVPALPPAATLLATNAFSPVQAFGAGEVLRAVQFHPEMDEERSRWLNQNRQRALDEQAPGGARAVLDSIRPSPFAARVLENWVRGFVVRLAARDGDGAGKARYP